MQEDIIYVTEAGYNKLQEKKNIYNLNKPLLLQKINKAKAFGDLKENAEYQAAMEEKAILDKKISDINGVLANCHIVEINKINEIKIIYGAYITLKNRNNNEIINFGLVSDCESDVDYHLLSIYSLLGKKLLGKKIGDIIEFNDEQYIVDQLIYDENIIKNLIKKSSDHELSIIKKSLEEFI